MVSLQTNVDSLVAQENLRAVSLLQAKTIEAATSGYRINSSGDDAAGLSIANRYRSDLAELTQGVRNANDGLSRLQIADSGIDNISRLLDRMKTLATQAASDAFTGDRSVLEDEYQQLLAEITRSANQIGLNSGGQLNTLLQAYVGGGGGSLAGSVVNVDLSGSTVDAASLGLGGSSLITGTSAFSNNGVNTLGNAAARFNKGTGGAQTFAVTYVNAGGAAATGNISIAATAAGVSGADFATAVNQALSTAGIVGVSCIIGRSGGLEFSGSKLLAVSAGTSGTAPTSLAVQSGASLVNTGDYRVTGALVPFAGGTSESLRVTVDGTGYTINLDDSPGGNTSATSASNLIASLNAQLTGSGVYAVNSGNQITLESTKVFSLVETAFTLGAGTPGTGSLLSTTPGAQATGVAGVTTNVPFTALTGAAQETLTLNVNGTIYNYTLNSTNAGSAGTAAATLSNGDIAVWVNGSNLSFQNTSWPWTLTVNTYVPGLSGSGAGSLFGTTPGAIAVTEPAAASQNARFAISSIAGAVTALGLVQGVIGSGQNRLNCAISLAGSQIASFSGAESRIRDADIAEVAATLSRVQILRQASIAAMAQANVSSQAVLKLLQ
jgi:flagellin